VIKRATIGGYAHEESGEKGKVGGQKMPPVLVVFLISKGRVRSVERSKRLVPTASTRARGKNMLAITSALT